jgi:hypothetical protein
VLCAVVDVGCSRDEERKSESESESESKVCIKLVVFITVAVCCLTFLICVFCVIFKFIL